MTEWYNSEMLLTWIAITILFFFVIVVSFIAFAYMSFKNGIERKVREAEMVVNHQKSLLKASVQIQEEERNRIAADLHDGLIGKLIRIRLRNEISIQNSEIELMIKESIEETRRISHDLAPPLLDYKNLKEINNDFLLHWQQAIVVQKWESIQIEPKWDAYLKTQYIRILQETFNNIFKHANASIVNIYVRTYTNQVILIISDNGIGFDINKVKKGIGIYSLESRTQLMNGKMKIKSKIGKGSKFIFILPH